MDYRSGCERAVARLLRDGTCVASAVIAVGLAIEMLHPGVSPMLRGYNGLDVEKIGVALFIFLPIARVVLMLVFFLGQRDSTYTAISAVVLAIIGTGFWVAL
jgi:uncharacterized membrane protein